MVMLMIYYQVMIKININEAKTHLSRYLANLAQGETIILCKRNVPIAEIRPLPPERTSPRPIGLAEGTFKIPAAFFEPLPDDLVSAFGGNAS
jgi:antitoxin (DNA-binding transcriptional repressor) of toxin-antitoxin stability system